MEERWEVGGEEVGERRMAWAAVEEFAEGQSQGAR